MSIGSTLAEARREAGLTITQVSQRTRIRESIIRGIEADDYSACGGDFYARGHIRSISSAIGIDPAPLVKDYDGEHGGLGSITAAEVFEPATPIKLGERRRSPSLSMIVIVALLGIIGFSIYQLTSRGGGGKPAAAAVQVHRPTPSATAVRAAPKPAVTVSPYAGKVVIQVTGTQMCWAQLSKVGDGTVVYQGDLEPGTSTTWTEKQPVTLQLGNPSGVQLTVNGKRINTKVLQPISLTFKPARA